MDNFDFGSPALQAMSVPAIAVIVVLAILTMRSVVSRKSAMMAGSADRAMTVSSADREVDAARAAYGTRRRGGLPTL